MERIKEALERARQERDTRGEGPAPAPLRDAPAPPPGQEQRITYTQTRSVHLEDRVARAQRLYPALTDEGGRSAYKILRTQVLQRLRREGWNAVAVTSPGSGAGKTLTAVNLALSIAAEVNQTVLLVDLDLRQPGVHRLLGITPEKGISDVLLGDAAVSDALVNPGIERLVVLPGREPVPNSSEMLSSPRMVSLVNELKSRYPSRIVLFDLPPVLSADDAMAFAPYVDGVLLVLEEGVTKKDEVSHTMEYLGGTNVLGTVLNKAEAPSTAAYAYG
jgi:capsular exopolysaccharide synthesis family protein